MGTVTGLIFGGIYAPVPTFFVAIGLGFVGVIYLAARRFGGEPREIPPAAPPSPTAPTAAPKPRSASNDAGYNEKGEAQSEQPAVKHYLDDH